MIRDFLGARRYARAIFEIARDMQQDELVEAELENLSESLKKEPKLEKFLTNPALKTAEKKLLFQKLYSKGGPAQGALLNFFMLLFQKNRFYLIHEIASEFGRIADEAQGQGVVEIRTAHPLSDAHRLAIVSRIERKTGKKMEVRATVDPSLLGGIRVQVGNRVIDDTIKTKIQNFKRELTKVQSI